MYFYHNYTVLFIFIIILKAKKWKKNNSWHKRKAKKDPFNSKQILVAEKDMME